MYNKYEISGCVITASSLTWMSKRKQSIWKENSMYIDGIVWNLSNKAHFIKTKARSAQYHNVAFTVTCSLLYAHFLTATW